MILIDPNEFLRKSAVRSFDMKNFADPFLSPSWKEGFLHAITFFEKKIPEEFETAPNKLKLVKKYITLAVDILLQQHLDTLAIGLNGDYATGDFTNAERDGIVNTALLAYLNAWLENAQNAKQTFYSFAKQPYALKEEQRRHKQGEDDLMVDEVVLARLKRNAPILKENYNISRETLPNSQANQTKKWNFTDLCFLEDCNNLLTLYKLVYMRKNCLEIVSRKSHENTVDPLETGFHCLDMFMKDTLKETSDKIFVVRSVWFFKFESTYRFLLAAHIAKYMYANSISLKTPLPDLCRFYCYALQDFGRVNGIFYSPLIISYDSLISSAYSENVHNSRYSKMLVTRAVLNEIYAIIGRIPRETLSHNISVEDFHDAASFLKDEFNLGDVFTELNLDQSHNNQTSTPSVYDYIRKLYLKLGLGDISKLNYSRDKLAAPKKQSQE